MIIDTIETKKGNITKLTVENDNYRITNNQYSFFLKSVFVGKNDNLDNYFEVSYDIWNKYINDEIPKSNVEILSAGIEEVGNKVSELEINTTETDDVIMCAIADVTEVQDEVTDVLLCAVDDLYEQLEPLLPEVQSFETANIISSGLCRLYLIMVKRNLKDIETVPIRYRNYIKSML